MQGKIMLVLGGAVGYVIGTRAGRQGYERLKRQAAGLWQSPRVQSTIAGAGDYAGENIPVVGGTLKAVVTKVASAGADAATNKHVASPSAPAVTPSSKPVETPTAEPAPLPAAIPTVDVVVDGPGQSPDIETPQQSESDESDEAEPQDSPPAGQPQQASNNG